MTFKLICFDLDGVIFKPKNFWLELHKTFNTYEKGKELTEKYLNSDYNKLVEEVVQKLWKGKPAKPYFDLVNSFEYMDGVEETLKRVHKSSLITAIVSTSSLDVARRAQKDFGFDHIFANELIIRDNQVTGEYIWPLGSGNYLKAKIVKDLCSDSGITLNECIFVGDNDTDVEVSKIVGLSIAFNSESKELKKTATYVVDSADLKDILKFIP
ncbi:MAG: HAD family phosphatase [Candidatus Woesearchaeota archaeon]